jgi:short subunit dehydrogenase-like uncharacterized protein
MTARIVVFGATGYTGRLVTAELRAAGHRPVVVGRDRLKVNALGVAHGGLETAVADAADPGSVRALVGSGDVLVATVGPFTRFGRPALDAAVSAGAHYLDCTGEGDFVQQVFADAGPRAKQAGCALLTGVGFDFVPGNLAGALALREAGADARRVDVGYFVTGKIGMSSGTRATVILTLAGPNPLLRGGTLVRKPFGREVQIFHGGGRPRPAALWCGTEAFTLPRLTPGLTDVATYVGGPGRVIRPVQAFSYPLAALWRVRLFRRLLDRVAQPALRASGRGPDPAERTQVGTRVLAVVRDGAGRELASARLEGSDPYTFTGKIMAWIAGHLASGTVAVTGALGPVDAFGVDELERAVAAAGIRRVE